MRNPKPKAIPIPGDMGHNAGFHTAIGSLVIHWANTESIYMMYLQVLLNQGQHDTAIIWHAQKSTAARLDTIAKLARSRLDDNHDLRDDVLKSVSLFRGFCNTRNFFCHAVYSYDGESKLDFAHGITLTQDDLYVRAGASPETVSPVLLSTPLLYAAANGSERVARYLVSAGAGIDRSAETRWGKRYSKAPSML